MRALYRVGVALAIGGLAIACKPAALSVIDDTPTPWPPTPTPIVGVPQPTARPAAPTVRVVPRTGASEAPPPGVPTSPTDDDPEEIAASEDVITLEAPAAYRGENDLHLQIVPPFADDPTRASTAAVGAVEIELRKDGLLRDPVVVTARIEADRLARGQVAVLFSGLADESYELVVKALDRSGQKLGEAEQDFSLAGGGVAPYLVRLPRVHADFKIEEAPQPYLQGSTATTMGLLWTSARDTVPGLKLADAAGKPVDTLDGAKGRRHNFALEGLTPATAYRWTATEDGHDVASGTFKTNAGPSGKQVRFAAVGDTGTGNAAQFAVARAIAAWKPDFMVIAGDVIYPLGQARHYGPRFLAPYRDLVDKLVIYPALGNHDYLTDQGQPYLDFFAPPVDAESQTERYYRIRWGHLEVWALDSNQDHDPASAQTKWLAKTLAASDATWKMAFFHHPPYSSGSHGSDEKLRKDWGPLFERHDVQLVITGHDHHYERMTPQQAFVKDGVPSHYVLTGGGGAGLRGVDGEAFTAEAREKYHFVGITLNDRSLNYEAIDDGGKVFDRFRYELPK